MNRPLRRLAFVVSHPIQYYVPLYQRLAQRDDLEIRVFYTWHAGESAVHDRGFGAPVAWDLPLTSGYAYEAVPNRARDPGTHHFRGLQNPDLIARIRAWRPDFVHLTGWAWQSHLQAMRRLSRDGLPVLFRGDSHLLDSPHGGPRWWLKREILRRVFSWPAAFLVVGHANRAYFAAFGVAAEKLHRCPHSIDVGRFAEPAGELERQAAAWRGSLGVAEEATVLLFAGKFERKKQPLALMQAVQRLAKPEVVLVLVGGGELDGEVRALAAAEPRRFQVLPFQNQSRMPTVYRLGDLFVLPSAFGETWGLAVNEALACGRPVLVSDRVGCAADVVDDGCGRVFALADPASLAAALGELTAYRTRLRAMRAAAAARSALFDIAVTEGVLLKSLQMVSRA